MRVWLRVVAIGIGLGVAIGVVYVGKGWTTRGIPFVGRQQKWAIGIFVGESPLELYSPTDISNPVLTAQQVTDVSAEFVADPFILQKDKSWYMFFEVMNARTNQGDIGLATSGDGFHWSYKQIVLDEPFHLSYPYVFKWGGEYYMIPESGETGSVRLYKALDFPTQWTYIQTLLTGDFTDPTLFYYDNRWWMFVGSTMWMDGVLRLYYAEQLTGPWMEHPGSPLVDGDANIARPGGRVTEFDGQLIRYAQDDHPFYGQGVRAFEITLLTPLYYDEREIKANVILNPGDTGWRVDGMHQVDPQQILDGEWLAAVDGFEWNYVFGVEH